MTEYKDIDGIIDPEAMHRLNLAYLRLFREAARTDVRVAAAVFGASLEDAEAIGRMSETDLETLATPGLAMIQLRAPLQDTSKRPSAHALHNQLLHSTPER